jgi:hypothetical protein
MCSHIKLLRFSHATRVNIGSNRTFRKMKWQSRVVTVLRKPVRKGAKAMLGYASTFRKPRTTAEWMDELREGERL